MGHLEDLPAPLPLYITKLLSDLKSLDALRQASPLFSVVFRQHAVEILEYLMKHTLDPFTVIELRANVLLKHTYAHDPDWTRLYADAVQPLLRDIPTTAISQTLYKFSFIHSLSSMIIHDRLARFRAMPHVHLVDMQDPHVVLNSPDAHPVPQEYRVPNPGPPSWIEEQRLARGLWRVNNCDMLGRPYNFFGQFLSLVSSTNFAYEEFEDARSALEDLQIPWFEGISRSHLSWTAPAERLSQKSLTAADVAWGHDEQTLRIRLLGDAPGFAFFHRTCLGLPDSPLRNADWAVLRRLGLGIWDGRRMAEELQLSNFPPNLKPESQRRDHIMGEDDYMSPHELLFTWHELYKAALSNP